MINKPLQYFGYKAMGEKPELELEVVRTDHGKMIRIMMPAQVCFITAEQAMELSRVLTAAAFVAINQGSA